MTAVRLDAEPPRRAVDARRAEECRRLRDDDGRPTVSANPAAASLIALQRSAGNTAVNALLAARMRMPGGRTELTVSQPADSHEQEADRVANAVIRMPEPSMQETPAVFPAASPNQVQRLCTECDEEYGKKTDAPAQRKEQTAEALPVAQSAAANIQPLRGGGSELPASTRAFFEPRFGADFSHVRVHTDPRAEEAAKSIGAKAFTLGNDIAFASGQYSPDSAEGRTLLAHELAHVTQASVVNGVIHRKPASGAPGGHELSDAELLALANLAPVRVEGSSDKRFEDVLIAANNGLIDIVTPSEFERQLRFRVERLGSTEFADSWTNDERFGFEQADPGDQKAQLADKWVSFIERGYMAYLADKAAQWRSATRRMHTAAVIGNVIGQVTVTAATLFIGGGGAAAARGGGGTALARETATTVLKREVEAVARNRAAEFADKAVRLATKVVPSPDTDKDKRRKKKKRDTCETLWGLSPGENARIFEQRAPIRGETTVDHVRFRLDRGIPPPPGGDTTRGSQEWTRRIGCPSDDAGHVLANRFGGFAFYNNQYGNIFPQDLTFNRGAMNRLDETVAHLHARGADVCVLIQLSYEPADSLRPTHAAYFIRARMPGAPDFVTVWDVPVRNESRDEGCEA